MLGISGNADDPDGLTFTDANGRIIDPAAHPPNRPGRHRNQSNRTSTHSGNASNAGQSASATHHPTPPPEPPDENAASTIAPARSESPSQQSQPGADRPGIVVERAYSSHRVGDAEQFGQLSDGGAQRDKVSLLPRGQPGLLALRPGQQHDSGEMSYS